MHKSENVCEHFNVRSECIQCLQERSLDGDVQGSGQRVLKSVYSDTTGTPHAQAELEGWVYKRGDWRNPSYKKRWFVLRAHPDVRMGKQLSYWKSKDAADAREPANGSLVVEGMHVEAETETGTGGSAQLLHGFAFTPQTGNENGHSIRRILCACETSEERDRWAEVLSAASAQIESDVHKARLRKISQVLEQHSYAMQGESRPLVGVVYKQGAFPNPAFQKRWFALREHRVKNRPSGIMLDYFKAKRDIKDSTLSRGSLICLGMTVRVRATLRVGHACVQACVPACT